MWKIDTGTQSGVTQELYADALNWKTSEFGSKTIILHNTHGEDSLKYRLNGFAAETGLPKELVSERSLSAGESAEFHYHRQWHCLVLQVKNGNGAASYQVDYEGQGV